MTNAEARFNQSLRPRKPEGSLGRTAQDGHLDSHTAPELCQLHLSLRAFIAAGRVYGAAVGSVFVGAVERQVYEILFEAGLGSREARCVALAEQ